jgi:hypothetical protein
VVPEAAGPNQGEWYLRLPTPADLSEDPVSRVPTGEGGGDACFASQDPMSYSCELRSRSGRIRLVNKRVSQQTGSVDT